VVEADHRSDVPGAVTVPTYPGRAAIIDAMADAVVFDGRSLTAADLARVADGAPVALDPDGRERAAVAWRAARAVVASGRTVYGRTTGVGANRGVMVSPADAAAHGARLLASHAVSMGPPVAAGLVRAFLAVRVNQLAAGGSGARPEVLDALMDLIDRTDSLVVHDGASLGTGDLSALAEVGLAVAGAVELDGGDALALMSSNALTLARAALDALALGRWGRAALVVATLSLRAVDGSVEPFDAAVHDAHPVPSAALAAAVVRRLLQDEAGWAAARVQDPYAWRALAAVTGPVLGAARRLRMDVEVEVNAAAENPTVVVTGPTVLHHAGFHLAQIALDLDAARLALHQAAGLSVARLAHLVDPRMTGAAPFLAAGPSASSGVLALEYAAQAALARVRLAAQPTTLASATISLGTEDHAPFAAAGAHQLAAATAAASEVVASELVAAVRLLRQRGVALTGRLGRAFEVAAAGLDPDDADRPLRADLLTAVQTLAPLSALTDA
jgi:histidine ammonia-lyase